MGHFGSRNWIMDYDIYLAFMKGWDYVLGSQDQMMSSIKGHNERLRGLRSKCSEQGKTLIAAVSRQ